MKPVPWLLCRLGFHKEIWPTGESNARAFPWVSCARDGCDWTMPLPDSWWTR